MLEMSSSGAGVLQLRAVEYARNHGVRLHCRSSFEDCHRYPRARRGRDDGTADGHRRHPRLRGAGNPHRPARRAGGRGPRVQRARRRERERRHDHPERAGLDRPEGRPLVHGRRATTCARRPRCSSRSGSAMSRPTPTSARSRSSAPGCAATRASPRRSSARSASERDQHRDDLDVADQDLVRDRRRARARRRSAALHDAFDLGADAVHEEDPSGEHRPRVTGR